ncbi:aquaporin-1-like [Solea senegalensis]|uniref:Aquaporin-1-like n=1 Tax=Solea senegalensis TaxID=28829 RepID=A0AAV6T675_SOLSE|nr:aquaporin-1-like isoform X2 [Solea senegalensis]KAG7524964.1 aquaporin-1-like [Solea senegalensis]
MSEIKTWAFWRAFLAESLGMMIFVFIGLSAAIGDRNNTYPDQEIKVAFAFGLAIATLAQSIGHISGAHLNPAITLGLLASCQMSILRALFYVIAQILGAVAGSAFVNAIRPEIIDSLGVNKLNGVSPSQGFAIEFLLTFQLVLCVLAVTDKRRDVAGFAPLAIGLSVGLGHLAGPERRAVFSSDMVYRSATQDVASTQLDPLGLQLYCSHLMTIGYTGQDR